MREGGGEERDREGGRERERCFNFVCKCRSLGQRRYVAHDLLLLCMVDPPRTIRTPCRDWLALATASASEYVAPPTTKTMIS